MASSCAGRHRPTLNPAFVLFERCRGRHQKEMPNRHYSERMHCQYAAHRSRTRTVPPVKTLIALCLALTLPWIASASVLPRAARPATPPIHAKAAPSPAMQAVTHFIYLHPTDRPVWQDYINAVQHSALTLERWYRAQLSTESIATITSAWHSGTTYWPRSRPRPAPSSMTRPTFRSSSLTRLPVAGR